MRTYGREAAGVLIIRRRNKDPRRRAAVPKKTEFSKQSHSGESCRTSRKYPIPYLDTLQDQSISLCITNEHYLIKLPKLYPILIH